MTDPGPSPASTNLDLATAQEANPMTSEPAAFAPCPECGHQPDTPNHVHGCLVGAIQQALRDTTTVSRGFPISTWEAAQVSAQTAREWLERHA